MWEMLQCLSPRVLTLKNPFTSVQFGSFRHSGDMISFIQCQKKIVLILLNVIEKSKYFSLSKVTPLNSTLMETLYLLCVSTDFTLKNWQVADVFCLTTFIFLLFGKLQMSQS